MAFSKTKKADRYETGISLRERKRQHKYATKRLRRIASRLLVREAWTAHT